MWVLLGVPPGKDSEIVSEHEPAQPDRPDSVRAAAARRSLLLIALGAVLAVGLVTALPSIGIPRTMLATLFGGHPKAHDEVSVGNAINHAVAGECLNWPNQAPESASIINCSAQHRFEVAASIDMRTFPGAEYAPSAEPPSPTRIQQISVEQCEPAVRRYLGTKFDPDSRFTVSMVWSGDRAWREAGQRRMLCGLELPGPNAELIAFSGKVAEIDQSKIWPAGTCLGIDPTLGQPVDVPVDCAAPHAMEVTGTVNLAEQFPDGMPTAGEQDDFAKAQCTVLTDTYLAPLQLRTTTLTLIYPTVSLPSWSAGSRKVACSIGATLGNGGWATLVGSAKGDLLINGQPPVRPPDIPEERRTPASIPLPTARATPVAPAPASATPSSTAQPATTQPAAPRTSSTQTSSTQTSNSPTSSSPTPSTQTSSSPAPNGQAPPPPGELPMPPQDFGSSED